MFRGRPKPYKDGFPIFQIGLLVPSGDNLKVGVIDLGGMKNIGTKYAVGATFSFEGDDDATRFALKPRVRRWLSKGLAIDLAPGLLIANELPGFVAELSLSAGDWVTLTGQMEVVQNKTFRAADAPYSGGDSETRWYAGAKLGGEAGLLAMLAAALIIVAARAGTDL